MNARIPIALAGVALASLAAAGCNSGGSSQSEASAKAAASSLAANPNVVKAEAEWKPIVTKCAETQHFLTHPVASLKATVACAGKDLTPAQRKAAETCATNAAIKNGLGKGTLAKDEASGALCLANVSPNGTTSVSPSLGASPSIPGVPTPTPTSSPVVPSSPVTSSPPPRG
jgi:hypothetical protein